MPADASQETPETPEYLAAIVMDGAGGAGAAQPQATHPGETLIVFLHG